MADHRFWSWLQGFGKQQSDTSPVRFVVLPSDVQNVGADNASDLVKNFRQPFGVVRLVDVAQIAFLLFGGRDIADIVDIEAERFGQGIKALQAQFWYRPEGHQKFLKGANAELIASMTGASGFSNFVGVADFCGFTQHDRRGAVFLSGEFNGAFNMLGA